MSPHHHPLPRTVYVGTVIDVPSPAKLRVRANAIVGVDEGGIIVFVRTRQENFEESGDAEGEWIRQESERCGWGKRGWEVVRAVEREGEFWFPGFVGEFEVFFLVSAVFLVGFLSMIWLKFFIYEKWENLWDFFSRFLTNLAYIFSFLDSMFLSCQ